MSKKAEKIKIMTIIGTRPEIIRLSRVMPKLDEYFEHKIVFTSQSFDYELSSVFFKELELRKPEYILQVKASTLGKQIGNILSQAEEIIIKEKPDAVLILGDTNSALSAIIAKRYKIPIFHMEAGNRSFDWNVPEEINRRIVDHISDYNLAYTEHSRRYLILEGIKPETIFVTGSPLAEVFEYFKAKIENSQSLSQLGIEKKGYFLVSTHREENVDNEENVRELFEAINALAEQYSKKIIISLHPRTKKKLESFHVALHPLVQTMKPFGYFDYNKLQKEALCVLSDSGTIQEESAILRFKAIQLRKSTERPEAFDKGSIIVCGFNKHAVLSAVEMAIKEQITTIPEDYKDLNISIKVVKLLLGFTSIIKYHDKKVQSV